MPARHSRRPPDSRWVRAAGFVVAELVVVLAVTAVLVAVIVISINGIDRDAVQSDCLSQQRALRVATEQFKANVGFYPSDDGDLVSAGLIEASDITDWKVVTADQAAGPVFKPDGSRCADV